MDRIQKALDKAKAKYSEQTVVTKPAAATAPEKKSVATAEEPLKTPIADIAYTHTRVIELSTERLEAKRIISWQYNNPQSAVFRMLRTQVLKKMRASHWQTLAITSPTAGEGKSLVAANLAVAMAMDLNQTVMLVDMDLRNPSMNDYFGLQAQAGLKDYLEQNISLTEVLVNPGIQRLVILPGKGRSENSAELLSTPKMASLVADLKSRYDSRMIIFDVPPVLQTDDVLLASKYFDCMLMVLEDGKNKEAEIIRSLHLLGDVNLIGSVLNKSENPPTHQNY